MDLGNLGKPKDFKPAQPTKNEMAIYEIGTKVLRLEQDFRSMHRMLMTLMNVSKIDVDEFNKLLHNGDEFINFYKKLMESEQKLTEELKKKEEAAQVEAAKTEVKPTEEKKTDAKV